MHEQNEKLNKEIETTGGGAREPRNPRAKRYDEEFNKEPQHQT